MELKKLIGRKDFNILMAEYKSINRILNAKPQHIEFLTSRKTADKITRLGNFVFEVLSERVLHDSPVYGRTEVAEFLRYKIGHNPVESVYVLSLDNANRPIGIDCVAEGEPNQCVVYTRRVFELTIRRNAVGFILAHNHPGGSTRISEADWMLTKKLHDIGKGMQIPLLDHFIVTDQHTVSLRHSEEWSSRIY